MSEILQGRAKSTQSKVGGTTTTIINDDKQIVSWDSVEEACHCTTFCNKDEKMTAPEAAAHFKIDLQGIYARARRHKWKLVNGRDRNREKKLAAKIDWAARGDDHRDHAFKVGHESLKKFKPRSPKNFRELEIADRMARRAAGLETADVINQTLVHINEAIDEHGDSQVIEAVVVDNNAPTAVEAATTDASAGDSVDTAPQLEAPVD
jgi:hypothetical protein